MRCLGDVRKLNKVLTDFKQALTKLCKIKDLDLNITLLYLSFGGMEKKLPKMVLCVVELGSNGYGGYYRPFMWTTQAEQLMLISCVQHTFVIMGPYHHPVDPIILITTITTHIFILKLYKVTLKLLLYITSVHVRTSSKISQREHSNFPSHPQVGQPIRAKTGENPIHSRILFVLVASIGVVRLQNLKSLGYFGIQSLWTFQKMQKF